MNHKEKNYIIAFFFISVLLIAPSAILTPINATQPDNNQNPKGKNNPNETAPGYAKKLIDQYPNTTPIQEKIKKAIDVMKNGDPKKPANNNGKKNPKDIPEFTSEVVSIEELKKNGKVVGKTIKTKSTLTFKNSGQIGQSDEEWNRFGFDKNVIGELDDDTFKKMCKEAKGKISKDGQFCDVKESIKSDINSQLSKLSNNWMNDDFYLLQGGSVEDAKEEAKKRGVFPLPLKNNDEKEFKKINNNFFKTEKNPNGLDINSHHKKFEFFEEYTVDLSETIKNLPSDFDSQNPPIIPSSYNFSVDDKNVLEEFFSADVLDLILPEVHAEPETENISHFAMMGFTIAPPKLDWSLQFSESVCFPIWYPTQLHIEWGGFLGLEITHFHLHFAHIAVCTEIFFFKMFANADIAAGFRLPVEVIFENVPKGAFPGDEFTIDTIVKPKDFTVQEYIDFCQNQDIKNDFFLKLSALVGQDPCTRFAFENFFYSDSAISGTGIGRIDPGHILVDGKTVETDGDEFVIKFKLGAGIEFKLINRTIDVCALLADAQSFSCFYGYDVDVGLSCTTENIPSGLSPLEIIQRLDLVLLQYPDEFVEKLKEEGFNCSSFNTPVGTGAALPFGIGLDIPADCQAVDESDFPPSDKSLIIAGIKDKVSPTKFGPMEKSEDDPKKCTKPGPKCICTNGILKEFGIEKLDATLGIGIGMSTEINFAGGPVTANLSIGGPTTPQSTVLEFDEQVRFEPDDFDEDSDCVDDDGILSIFDCSNFELSNLEFVGVKDNGSGESEINITPSDGASDDTYITATLDDFEISFQSFTMSATPTVELTGTFVEKLEKFIPTSFPIELLTVSVPVDLGSGIPIGQHARTSPISISIPVNSFGVVVPRDIEKEAEGVLTFVDIGQAIIDADKAANLTVSNNLAEVSPDSLFSLGATEILWMANNTSDPDNIETREFSQIITIVDTTPPEISAPDNRLEEAQGLLTPVSIGFPNATDIVDSSLEFSVSYQIGNETIFEEFLFTPEDGFSFESDFPLGATVVEWTATDDSGNEGKDIQIVSVSDTTPPIIVAPDDVFEFIDGFQSPIVFGFANVTDLVDSNPGISVDKEDAEVIFTCADGTNLEETTEIQKCDDGSDPEKNMVANFTLGSTNVVWTAVDQFGNNATDTQTVDVSIKGDFNQNFIQDSLEVDGFPCSVDSVPCKFAFTDEFGNTASGEIIDRGGQSIVVLLPEGSSAITIATGPSNSTEPAKISVCDDLATINLDAQSQVAMFCGSVTVTGLLETSVVEFNVGNDIASILLPSFTSVKYDDFFFNLEYIVGENNTMNQPVSGTFMGEPFVLSEEFSLFNLDTIPPELIAQNQEIGADIPQGAYVNYTYTVSDNLDPNPMVTCDPPEGTFLDLGSITNVTCIAKDTSDNFSEEKSFNATIVVAQKTFDGFKQQISSLDLKTGTEKSLLTKIDSSAKGFAKENLKQSENSLNSLINEVNANSGKSLNIEDSEFIKESANLLIAFYNGTLVFINESNELTILPEEIKTPNQNQSSTEFSNGTIVIPSSSTEFAPIQAQNHTEYQSNSTQFQENSKDSTLTSMDSDSEINDNEDVENSTKLERNNSKSSKPEQNHPIDKAEFFSNPITSPITEKQDLQTSDNVNDDDSKGGGKEHLTRPTFGLSHETFETIVDSGFRFNDQSFTINDNHHTPFAQQTVNIGEVNSFEAKIYADKRLKVQEFLFGIPVVGMAHLAELGVEVWYDYNGNIEDVKAIQKSNVIDKNTITATHEKVKCQQSDLEEKCDVTEVSMVFLEPLKDQVMAVKAIDYKGRYQITYLNEGVEISGESLNPMPKKMIPANLRDQGLIVVTQVAKYSPYWQSEDGRMFEMNDFGSFREVNQKFERFHDTGTAYTRLHSDFGKIMEYELKRATNVFDGEELIKDLPESVETIILVPKERITDDLTQRMLEQEELAKRILEKSKVQARW